MKKFLTIPKNNTFSVVFCDVVHTFVVYDTKVTETKKYLEKVLDNEVINPDKNFVDRIYHGKHLLGGDFINSIVKYLVDQHNKISHNSEPK